VKEFYNRILNRNLNFFFAVFTHAILLDQAFADCPRFFTADLKSRPYLNSSVADRSLEPTKHHRLGKLLPYQLPNTTKVHFKAK